MGRRRTWTDDQLRAAVAASTTFTEVVERLRATVGKAGYRAARVRIELLDLDTSHFADASPLTTADGTQGEETQAGRSGRRRWSDEDLARAVREVTSLNGVFEHLGLVVGGTQWEAVRGRIRDLGLDTTHWRRPIGRPAVDVDYSDDDLRRLVPHCRSYAEVMRGLGLNPSGRRQARVRDRIHELGLDTSHMTGQGWARGVANPSRVEPRPLSELLVRGSGRSNGHLKRRLLAEGVLEARCATCELDTWMGEPIPLELDHINGDRRDNRLRNLRLLCPNCHALTETYRGRNIGRYDPDRPGGQ